MMSTRLTGRQTRAARQPYIPVPLSEETSEGAVELDQSSRSPASPV